MKEEFGRWEVGSHVNQDSKFNEVMGNLFYEKD